MKKTLVSSSCELDELLSKKYGAAIETDKLSTLMGGISGTYKGEKFHITFGKNEYLLISISNNGKVLLDELMPVLNEVMVSTEPIVRYDLQSEDKEEKEAMPTIEWDIKDPESRLKAIINGRVYSEKAKLHNLTLFGERKIESYIEDEKMKEERIANAKIYGIYPGSIKDTESFNTMSEIDLYFNIDAMGGHIWRCRHDMSHGRIPEIDLTEEQYALEYMVYQTTRFGVELPKPEIDKHIVGTPSYVTWYSFYSNHFKRDLTNSQWDDFQMAKEEGNDVSAFMPKGNWKYSLEKPTGKKLTLII